MAGDTYDSQAEAGRAREQLRSLLLSLNAWDRALRRDECNAWVTDGNRGKVCTWGDGKSWVLYVGCNSSKGWTHARRRL